MFETIDASFNLRESLPSTVNHYYESHCPRATMLLHVSGCHCFSNYPVGAERRALERSSITSSFAIEIIWRHGLLLSLILWNNDDGNSRFLLKRTTRSTLIVPFHFSFRQFSSCRWFYSSFLIVTSKSNSSRGTRGRSGRIVGRITGGPRTFNS